MTTYPAVRARWDRRPTDLEANALVVQSLILDLVGVDRDGDIDLWDCKSLCSSLWRSIDVLDVLGLAGRDAGTSATCVAGSFTRLFVIH